MTFTVKTLGPSTWDAFAELVEHRRVFMKETTGQL
jgi:hypothetical protein